MSYISFNPRARMGRDLSDAARARGRVCFNPRARMGRDVIPVFVSLRT